MRILIHSRTFLPRVGGLEQSSLALAEGLSRRGHHVVIATDVDASADVDAGLGFSVVRGPTLGQLFEEARRADIVHSSGHSMVAVSASILARRRLVIAHHGYQAVCLNGLGWHNGERCGYRLGTCFRLTREDEGARRAYRQLARHLAARGSIGRASAHVAVSHFVAGALRIRAACVIHNCADTRVFRNAPEDRPRGAFLFVGRFVAEKGVGCLLRAFSRYRAMGGRLRLDLVGAGPEERAYRAAVAAMQLGAAVTFVGSLRGEA